MLVNLEHLSSVISHPKEYQASLSHQVTWNRPPAVAKSGHEPSWLTSQVLESQVLVWRCKVSFCLTRKATSTATAKSKKDLRNMHKSGVQGLDLDLVSSSFIFRPLVAYLTFR